MRAGFAVHERDLCSVCMGSASQRSIDLDTTLQDIDPPVDEIRKNFKAANEATASEKDGDAPETGSPEASADPEAEDQMGPSAVASSDQPDAGFSNEPPPEKEDDLNKDNN